MTPRISNWMLPLIVLLAGLGATYFLQHAAIDVARQTQRDNFNFQTNEVMLRIEQRLAAYEQVLRGAKGMFAASKVVERKEFHDYVTALGLAEHYPGIQGVGFSLIISPQEMDMHTRAIRKEGFPNYAVYPQGKRDLYTSIIFLEPFTDRNLRAFSYDMYSEPVRRAAMERARDSGKAAMSGKVLLVQETQENVQAGFLMYLPVYRNGRPHETQAERRANIIGWAYSPFRMNDLMEGILGKSASNIDLEIYDSKDEAPEALMYDSQSGRKRHESPQLVVSKCMEIAGHSWHIRLHSLPVFEAGIDTGRAVVVRVTGIMLSALLSLLVWLLASGRVRALNLAEKMTRELRESEAMSRSIIEAIPVPLALNDEQGNITYLNRAFVRTVGYTLDEIPTLGDWWPRAYPDAPYRQLVVEGWRRNMEQAKCSNESFVPMELEIICKDGQKRTFLAGAASIRENFAGTHLVVLYDITDRKQAEQLLHESEQRYSHLVSNIPDGVYIWVFAPDGTGKFKYVSPRFCEILELRAEDVLRNPELAFVAAHPDDLDSLIQGNDQARLTLQPFRWEGRFVIHGETRWISIASDSVVLPDGGSMWSGVLRDVTERKQAEKELRTLSTAIEQSPLSVVITDLEAKIQYVNPHFIKTTGYSWEEAIGQNPRILQSGLTPKSTYDELWKKLTSGQIWRGELVNKRKNGEFYWEEVHIAPVNNFAGTPILYVAVKLEITKRKQIENALRESKEHIETLLHSVAEGIYGVDMEGNCTFVNSAALKLLGYREEAELLGKPMHDLIHHTHKGGSPYPSSECYLYHGMHTREGIHVSDEVFWRKDGSSFPVDCWSRPTRLNGRDGAVVTFFDITERKAYEEELKRSNAELEQFSYAVSHDMRQPLRMISSYLQLIEISLAGQLDEEKRGYFNFAVEGAKRIDHMLVALLEYSRVGRKGEPSSWADSRALLDEVLQFLQPAIAEAQARVDIAGEWPRIFASHDEILRLLQNLIGNAVKFRVAGRAPEVTVTSEVVGHEWHLCVADNGVGIASGQAKRLFQVFQRLQSRDAYEGTGIGLALCRKIAEHHKGRIWAESEGENRGSKFCFALPVLRDRHVV